MAPEVHTRLHSNCAKLAHNLCAQNCTTSAQIVHTKSHKMAQEVHTLKECTQDCTASEQNSHTNSHKTCTKIAYKIAQQWRKLCTQNCRRIVRNVHTANRTNVPSSAHCIHLGIPVIGMAGRFAPRRREQRGVILHSSRGRRIRRSPRVPRLVQLILKRFP